MDKPLTTEEIQKIVYTNLWTRAERMARKFNQAKKVYIYKVGDKVRVSAEPAAGKKRCYIYLATIAEVPGNHTYKVQWYTEGPKKEDVEGTISQKCIPHRYLRLDRVARRDVSETTGRLFHTPPTTPTKGIIIKFFQILI